MMISTKIKEATKVAHQELEKIVVTQLKSIRSEADYAALLKNFYAYFSAVEEAISPYITAATLPDLEHRRNATYIKKDIEQLDGDLSSLPSVTVPHISNTSQAFGALYVLEGSITGGPYIVKMLEKYGLKRGFEFFSGYGDNTRDMWSKFTEAMNKIPKEEQDERDMLNTASETFERFGDVFNSVAAS